MLTDDARDRWGRSERDEPDLDEIIRQVRRRWRLKHVLQGVALFGAASLGLFVIAAAGLTFFKFNPLALVGVRILSYVGLAAIAALFIVRPLLRRVTDEQVALYLEEHGPERDAEIVSAVEIQRQAPAGAFGGLGRRLVGRAIERCRELEFGRALERQSLQRAGGSLLGIVAAALLLWFFGPASLRYTASALLVPTGSAATVSPYRIEVTPGNATVPRGSDQTITARLVGFEATQVELLRRTSAGGTFDRLPFVPAAEDDPAAFEVMIFDVSEPTEYLVQSAGVASETFRLEVVDLPYADRIELEYRFPAYTGLEPRLIEDGGDIAVLKGTEVVARIASTLPTGRGDIVIDDEHRTPLTVEQDGRLLGRFTVERDGFYRIELEGPDRTLVSASPQFTIDALDDQPPTVSFSKPGRDSRATNIEEIFLEARADDDFGVQRLDLVYSVNGGDEKSIRLYGGGEGGRREVSAGHTFFLEEFDLEIGDVVSYYARATDNNQAGERQTVSSDIYFIQIRSFRKDFRAAESQAGGGMGGMGGGATPGGLSEQQRQIVAATFNVLRNQETATAEERRENLVFLTLAQGQLREQVETLAGRLNSRIVETDPNFEPIADLLPRAAEEMRAAEQLLQAQNAKAALAPEQRALQHLIRAEEAYNELRVTMDNQGGGGGGGSSPQAEDLADLFELELDKLQNQYETLQRGQMQAADNQVDELVERLRELARRQEQEAERQRRRLAGNPNAQPGGSASQRRLAEETEEAARRLERLSREQNRPDLAEAARRMQEAADAMRRAAASGDPRAVGEAGAALERLREARERLEREQSDRLTRNIQDALERVRRLAEDQEGIQQDVDALGGTGQEQQAIRDLMARKDAQAAELSDLERQLDRSAADFSREQPEASRQVREAADGIRDDKLKEKIRYSKGLIQGNSADYARQFERQIGADLQRLEDQLREAAAAVGSRDGDRMTEALERTRDLIRGMESVEQRMRDGSLTGQPQQDGQQAEGQSSAEGQPGQSQGQESQGQQGAGQQAGQPGAPSGQAGDQPGTQPGGMAGDSFGGRPGDLTWGGSSRPGPYSTEDVRQLRREFRERGIEAQELRRDLAAEEVDVEELDAILRALRDLDSQRTYADAAEIERLQAFVIEGLKRFEYALRRELRDPGDDQLFLSGSEETPAGYRELVEEYYRSLSRQQP